jgi:tetratricopeptide (TPR) repeat protein
MSPELLNQQAKEAFDNKDYKKALSILESINAPELIFNIAKCYYYTKQVHKAISLIEPIASTHDEIMDLALYYNAIGDYEKAYQMYSGLDNSDPRIKFNLGWHYLRHNEFKKGFQNIQYGAKCRAWGSEYFLIEQGKLNPNKRWTGQFCSKLVLILEGGLGDEFIFIRWANHLKQFCQTLTISCDRKLVRLFTNSGYDVIPSDLITQIEYDFYIPAMSLPAIIDIDSPTQYVNFPYINSFAEPYIIKQLDLLSGNRKKIGIRWQGNPEFEHDQHRTIPKESLRSLEKYGQLFSIQLDDDLDGIPNCKHLINDWQDTYSVFSGLDLLVTSCTSTAHLAGAMGIPCIVMVPLVSYFCWASKDQPWYPTLKVIYQKDYDNWDSAFSELYDIMDSL